MTVPRLQHEAGLSQGAVVTLDPARAHYLRHVLRLAAGAELRLFNATEGEWRAVLHVIDRRDALALVEARVRAPAAEPGPILVFAPIRASRLDWLVEKAVELGAAALVPVLTTRTVVRLEKVQRLVAIATEAAEQCGRLTVPPIAAPRPLAEWLAARPPAAPLLVADPGPAARPILAVLDPTAPPAMLVGPEGGLTAEEVAMVLAAGGRGMSLGPRVLRAETAALACLVAWQVAAAWPERP